MIKYLRIILFCLVPSIIYAQDFQYSQFYAAPLYINPGFTGLTNQHRIVANVRNQWPGLPNDYLSTSFSYDQWIEGINSGVGVVTNGELSGTGRLWRAEIAPSYAYQAVISEKVIVRPGIKVGLNSIGINKNRLLFNDELETGQSTTSSRVRSSRFYTDISAGVLAIYDNYWGGLSISHLNRPDHSLIDNSQVSRIPRKWSVQLGAKVPLENASDAKIDGKDLTFALHYKAQGKFDQLDIGGYYNANPIILGIWYRGLPLKSNHNDSWNADAITLLFGIKKEGEYSLGFSYDITVSKLAVNRSAGSFELSYIKEWMHKKKKRKKQFIIPCAKF